MIAEEMYRKSSYSDNGPQCVEVAYQDGEGRVRDTKFRQAGHIEVADWKGFIGAVKTGRFDL